VFEAAMRENFGHLKRIHIPEAVFQAWTQQAKEGKPGDICKEIPGGLKRRMAKLLSLGIFFSAG